MTLRVSSPHTPPRPASRRAPSRAYSRLTRGQPEHTPPRERVALSAGPPASPGRTPGRTRPSPQKTPLGRARVASGPHPSPHTSDPFCPHKAGEKGRQGGWEQRVCLGPSTWRPAGSSLAGPSVCRPPGALWGLGSVPTRARRWPWARTACRTFSLPSPSAETRGLDDERAREAPGALGATSLSTPWLPVFLSPSRHEEGDSSAGSAGLSPRLEG